MNSQYKILINLYKLKDLASGLGQFSYQFGSHLCNTPQEGFEYSILAPKNFKNKFGLGIHYKTQNFLSIFSKNWCKKYDLYHCVHQDTQFLPPKKVKFIITIHDMNFLFEKSEGRSKEYLDRLQKLVNRADAITAISDFTKKNIETNLNLNGKKVHVIKNGIEIKHCPNPSKPKFAPNAPFLFTIGIVLPKKNFHTLIPMMKELQGYKLIIAGNNSSKYAKEIQRRIEKEMLHDRIIMAGAISEEEKFWCYQHCEAFVFPSLYEGFGMPVIEAMRMGKPVITSKSTSLPEIGNDKAYYWDNFDQKHMAHLVLESIRHFMGNKETNKQRLIDYSHQFTWENAIKKYTDLYETVLKK